MFLNWKLVLQMLKHNISLIKGLQHLIVLQVDWMNKFIFDMWPFLDKVLLTFIWLIWYNLVYFAPVHHFCVV
jgi:hypothetical protein